jgi:hypothetical protein
MTVATCPARCESGIGVSGGTVDVVMVVSGAREANRRVALWTSLSCPGSWSALATTTVWPARTLPCPCPGRCLCWHSVTKNMPLARSRNYSEQSALCDGARKCVTAKGMSARSRARRTAVVRVRTHQLEWLSSQSSGQLSNGACARLSFTALDAGDGSGTQASKRSKFALGQSGLHAASAEPTEMNHGRASRSYSGVGQGSRAGHLTLWIHHITLRGH